MLLTNDVVSFKQLSLGYFCTKIDKELTVELLYAVISQLCFKFVVKNINRMTIITIKDFFRLQTISDICKKTALEDIFIYVIKMLKLGHPK